MKTLKKVRQFLSDIDHIHQGGCAIAAYSMYLWLKKNHKLPKTFCFVYLYDDPDQFESNDAVLKRKRGRPTSCTHAGIIYRRKKLDCKKEIQVPSRFIHCFEDEEFMVKSINNIPTWNPNFHRTSQIPIIEKTLNIDLSNIKKSSF